jgi:CubicO group peptidase (beta-lactamase class C family)
MADPTSAAFAAFIEDHLDAANVAGAGIALTRGGELAWIEGFGVADAREDLPVAPDSIFMLASASKMFTAAAAVQAAERGLLELDAPVNDVLPFEVSSPWSSEPITAWQLLEHRAGLVDDDRVIWGHYGKGDSEEALGDWLYDVLHPEGDHYSEENFLPEGPDTTSLYSNTGYALLGYLVESAAGEDFSDWSRRTLLEPLGLEDTRWMLAELPDARVAHPHARRLLGPGHRRLAHYGYPDYPDGQLRSTPADLARFMGFVYGGGDPEILSDDGAELLWDGLGWQHGSVGEASVVGHGGSDDGVNTQVWLERGTGDGFILLMNSRIWSEGQEESIRCLEAGLMATAQAL